MSGNVLDFIPKRDAVDWDAAVRIPVDRLEARNTRQDIVALNQTLQRLLSARIEVDARLDPARAPDYLVHLARVLQLGAELKMAELAEAESAADDARRRLAAGGVSGGVSDRAVAAEAAMDTLQAQADRLEQELREQIRRREAAEAEASDLAAEVRGLGAGGGLDRRLDALERELEDQRAGRLRAEKEARDAVEAADRESARNEDLGRELRAERARGAEAATRLQSAKDDIADLKTSLAESLKRGGLRDADEKGAAAKLSTAVKTIDRLARDNRLLERAQAEATKKAESLEAELLELSESAVATEETLRGYKSREAEILAALEDRERERAESAAQAAELHAALGEKMALLDEFEDKYARQYNDWAERLGASEGEVMSLRAQAESLRADVAAAGGVVNHGLENGGLESLRLEAARASGAVESETAVARRELAGALEREAVLVDYIEKLEKDGPAAVAAAVASQQRDLDQLRAGIRRREETGARERDAAAAAEAALEAAKADADEQRALAVGLSTGVYGLAESLRDVRALKGALRAKDGELAAVVKKMNGLAEGLEDAREEGRFLRAKCGIREDAALQVGDYKLRSQVESAQLRALNARLEREIAELEEERANLKTELRFRAAWQGEHAAKMGLSPEQLSALEEYSDDLRLGAGGFHREGRTVAQLSATVKRLQARLVELTLNATLAADGDLGDFGGGATTGGGTEAGRAGDRKRAGRLAAAVRQAEEDASAARVEAATLLEQNRRLREEFLDRLADVHRRAATIPHGGGLGTMTAELLPLLHAVAERLKESLARDEDVPGVPGGNEGARQAAWRAQQAAVAAQHGHHAHPPTQPQSHGTALMPQQVYGGAVTSPAPPAPPLGPEPNFFASATAAATAAPARPLAPPRVAPSTPGEAHETMALKEQLVELLGEARQRDAAAANASESLARAQDRLRGILDSRALLYRQHARLRAEWAAERAAGAAALAIAESSAAEAATKASGYQSLAETLRAGLSPGEAQAALAEATTKLIVTQVTEVRLRRELEAARAAEATVERSRRAAEEDLAEVSDAARERTAAAEAAEAEAERRSAELLRELGMCVPREAFDRLAAQNRALAARHASLFALKFSAAVSESATAATAADAASNAESLSRLTREMADLTAEASELRAVVRGEDPQGLKEELVVSRVRERQAAARADIAEAERSAADRARIAAVTSLRGLESEVAGLTGRLHAALERERKAADAADASVPRKEVEGQLAAAHAALAASAEASVRVSRLENELRAAAAHLRAAKAERDGHRAEAMGLKAALRDLAQTSDGRKELGGLMAECLALRERERQYRQRAARAEAAAAESAAAAAAHRRSGDDKAESLFAAREALRVAQREHREVVAGLEAACAGRARAEGAEAEASLRLLGEANGRTRAAAAAARAAREDAAAARDAIAELESRLAQARSHDALAAAPASEAHRLAAGLAESLLQAQLASRRRDRELESAVGRAAELERLESEREAATRAFEEEALRAQARLSHEVESLRAKLTDAAAAAEAARADAARAPPASAAAALRRSTDRLALLRAGGGGDGGDSVGLGPSLGVVGGSAQAHGLILQQVERIARLRHQGTELAEGLESAQAQLHAARSAMASAQEEASLLRTQLTARMTAARDEGGVGGGANADAVEQMRQVAEVTVSRLHGLLADKDRALDRARSQLSDARAAAAAAGTAERAKTAALADQLAKKEAEGVAALRRVLADAEGRLPAGELAHKYGEKSYQQLIDLCAEREAAASAAVASAAAASARADEAEARLAEEIASHAADAGRLTDELAREKSRGPSKMLGSLVARLKAQVGERDAKLEGLKAAVKELEVKLSSALKGATDAVIAESASRAGDNAVAQLASATARAAHATEKLGRVQAEAIKAGEALKASEAERARLAAVCDRQAAAVLAMTRTAESAGAGGGVTPVIAAGAVGGAVARPLSGASAAKRASDAEAKVAVLSASNARLREQLAAGGGGDGGAAMGAGSGAAGTLQVRELREVVARLTLQLKKAAEENRRLGGGRAGATTAGAMTAGAMTAGAMTAHRASAESLDPPTRDGEGAAGASVGAAGESGGESSRHAVSLLAGNPGLEKWEESKRLEKRLEVLRTKLAASTAACAAAEKEVARLRPEVASANADRQATAAKLRAVLAGGAESSARGRRAADVARLRELSEALGSAEDAVTRLESESLRQSHRVKELETSLERATRDAAGRAPPRAGAPSEAAVAAATRRAEDAALHAEQLGLELAHERAAGAAALQRMRDRARALFDADLLAVSAAEASAASRAAAAGGGNIPESVRKVSREAELEAVIDRLKAVLEKLKAENESLRRSAVPAQKYVDAVQKAKKLAEGVAALEAEKAARQRGEGAGQREAAARVATAEAAAAKLGNDLAAARARCEAAELRASRAEAAAAAAASATATAATATATATAPLPGEHESAATASAVAHLRRLLQQSQSELESLKRGLPTVAGLGPAAAAEAEARAREAESAVAAARRHAASLAAENAALRSELDAFDPAFWAEITGLKNAHARLRAEHAALLASLGRR